MHIGLGWHEKVFEWTGIMFGFWAKGTDIKVV